MDYDLDDYLFDLNGFIVLKNAVEQKTLDDMNALLDTVPQTLGFEDWWGRVQRLDNNKHAGMELQNIVEAGEPFERLIDHPAWIERLHKYCGEMGSYVDGLFIDECFATFRRTGGYFPFHSGGHEGQMRNAYRFINGKWFCGQVNILLALRDIGPGDGGTVVIPGSHKGNLAHPELAKPWAEQVKRGHNNIPGVHEVHLKAGDALMFCDGICHGGSARVNPGERRAVIYRYGPSWGNTRYGFRYSKGFLDRLTPARRKIMEPLPVREPASSI